MGSKLTRWRPFRILRLAPSSLPTSPVARVSGKELTKVRRAVLFRRFRVWARRGSFPPVRASSSSSSSRPSDARKRKFLRNPDRPSFLPPSFHPPTCSAVAHLTGGRWPSPPPLLFFMGGVGRIKEGSPPPAREQKPDDWSDPRVRDRFN